MYDRFANLYDVIELDNQGNTILSNKMIVKHLRKSNAISVLDMTCGTGAQATYLSKQGFKVTASDLSQGMIDVAKRKAQGLDIQFFHDNMITINRGQFDAVISMYNAIGHLGKHEFIETVRNAANNLHQGGIYIFDIFNAQMMKYLPKNQFIDVASTIANKKFVRFIQFVYDESSAINTVMHSTHIQSDVDPIEHLTEEYTLQTYSPTELKKILRDNGFSSVSISSDGWPELFGGNGMVNFVVAVK